MNWEKTEELFKNGLLIDELKKIDGSNIEIQYPSKNFGKIYRQVVNYKKNKNSKIDNFGFYYKIGYKRKSFQCKRD